MLLLISILIAISFWVFIFLFFIKRADNFIKKFDAEVKDDIEKSKRDIQSIVTQAVEKSVKSLVTAEQEIVPKLEDAKGRIESSEKRLIELLSRIKIKGVVKEELAKFIAMSQSGQPFVNISEYYGDLPKEPTKDEALYELISQIPGVSISKQNLSSSSDKKKE
jgi:F0F1-type ATP synthase membrane subunit b/b'